MSYRVYKVKTRPSSWPYRYIVIGTRSGKPVAETFTKWGAKRRAVALAEPIKSKKLVGEW